MSGSGMGRRGVGRWAAITAALVCWVFGHAGALAGQDICSAAALAERGRHPPIVLTRLDGPITLDGVVTEEEWGRATAIPFTQMWPASPDLRLDPSAASPVDSPMTQSGLVGP